MEVNIDQKEGNNRILQVKTDKKISFKVKVKFIGNDPAPDVTEKTVDVTVNVVNMPQKMLLYYDVPENQVYYYLKDNDNNDHFNVVEVTSDPSDTTQQVNLDNNIGSFNFEKTANGSKIIFYGKTPNSKLIANKWQKFYKLGNINDKHSFPANSSPTRFSDGDKIANSSVGFYGKVKQLI